MDIIFAKNFNKFGGFLSYDGKCKCCVRIAPQCTYVYSVISSNNFYCNGRYFVKLKILTSPVSPR